MQQRQPVVAMRGIVKRFGDILANDHVDFEVAGGEIHALLGENGAGKSTLMNVLYGIHRPDAGEIALRGRPVEIGSPLVAARLGLGMVHQHFRLLPSLTVAENIYLGHEPTRGASLDHEAACRRAAELAERHGLQIDPRARIRHLSVGQRQRVEILKALAYDADVLILDEPTAVLTPQESDELFVMLRRFAEQGRTVIFITHKLREVRAIADRLTVMRDGRRVATVAAADGGEADIARMMVGREVLMHVDRTPGHPGPILLSLHDLRGEDDRGVPAVNGVSLDVRAGEIVGIAGVEGNGQSELVEMVTGTRTAGNGQVFIGGRPAEGLPVRARRRLGLGFIPEDRLQRGVSVRGSILENLIAGHMDAGGLLWHGVVRLRRARAHARRLIRRYDIRGARLAAPVGSLSGGNMQKLVLARELGRRPAVLVAAQPTRGLDIGAIEFVHRTLLAERDRGCAILLVSADLNEVMRLADRILVMYRGEVAGAFPAGTDENTLGLYMMGSRRDPGATGLAAPAARKAATEPAAAEGAPAAPAPAAAAREPDPEEPAPRPDWRAVAARLGSGLLQPAVAVAIALAVGLFAVVAIGDDPGPAYANFLFGSFASRVAFGNMLATATPLILTGISVAVAFQSGVFNIGGEGQLYLGAFAGAWAGFTFVHLPGVLLILAVLACAAVAGGIWGVLPGWLKAYYGVDEIVTTIMLNYVAMLLTDWLTGHPFKDPTAGAPVTVPIAPQAQLPGFLAPSSANAGFWIALAVVALAAFALYRTRWGTFVRLTGSNPAFVEAAGVSVRRVMTGAMWVSGALAGIAGAVEVLGIDHRFIQGFSPGYGFLGLTVALLGRLNPWGVLAAGLLYAILTNGASVMQQNTPVPYPLINILEGVIVLFMTAEGVRALWQRRRRERAAAAAPPGREAA